jgi:hypothetical protein
MIREQAPPRGPVEAFQLPPLDTFEELILLIDPTGTEACFQKLPSTSVDIKLIHNPSSLAHGATAKERGKGERKTKI